MFSRFRQKRRWISRSYRHNRIEHSARLPRRRARHERLSRHRSRGRGAPLAFASFKRRDGQSAGYGQSGGKLEAGKEHAGRTLKASAAGAGNPSRNAVCGERSQDDVFSRSAACKQANPRTETEKSTRSIFRCARRGNRPLPGYSANHPDRPWSFSRGRRSESPPRSGSPPRPSPVRSA